MSAGLLGQWGLKSETTFGTAVTPDKFHQGFLSGVPARQQPPLISNGIVAGRYTPKCLSTGAKIVSGTVKTELVPSPMSTLLRHMFGTIATTGAGPYTHTASPGPLKGQSLTLQFGVPGTGGTVHPFTFSGCKIPKWVLGAKAGELATLDFDFSAKDYVTATALASASYGTSCPFTYINGSVSVAGVVQTSVKSFQLTATRPMRVGNDGIFIGATTIGEQLGTGRGTYVIDVDAEFEDLTIHNLANTAVAVVLTFSNGTDSLTITCNSWVDAMTPNIEGVDSLSSFKYSLECYGSSDAAAITAVLVNSESTDT